jgi:metal-responsive CopG/Arc/MetJ family transcriptional regulator
MGAYAGDGLMARPTTDRRRVQVYLDSDTLARLDRWAEEHGAINERGEYSRSVAVEYLVRRATKQDHTKEASK